MSSLYLFRSFPIYDSTLDNWSPHIAIYGDMGNTNAQSLPRLQRYIPYNHRILFSCDFYLVCRHEINIFPSFIRQYFREAQEGMYDMVIHVGDFAYNMDTVGIKTQHRKE